MKNTKDVEGKNRNGVQQNNARQNNARQNSTNQNSAQYRYTVRDNDLEKILKERQVMLLELLKKKRADVEKAPAGTLRILKKQDHDQYYWRRNLKDTNGAYIRKKDEEIARRLAQKDYDEKVLKIAEAELSETEKYISFLRQCSPEGLYGRYSEQRRKLIDPLVVPDELFTETWRNEEYEALPFDPDATEYVSAGGIRVRSKAEVMIADMLEYYNIPYRYEYPLILDGFGQVRPDFLCLNVSKRKEIVWEHYGMMDNISYANRNVKKINAYESNGFFSGNNMIQTFETSQIPLDSSVIRRKIEYYLE